LYLSNSKFSDKTRVRKQSRRGFAIFCLLVGDKYLKMEARSDIAQKITHTMDYFLGNNKPNNSCRSSRVSNIGWMLI